MPQIQGIRRSPLDLNKNVKIGVAFPLDETNIFASTETLIDQAKSNLLNLLLTAPGERINLPLFGVGVKQLLFEQQIDLESLKDKIIKQSTFYVANIQVIDVRTALSENESTLFVSITYRSLLDNTVDAVQLNFNN
jgi:phage baseplate assembly protein W|tara:strand:- start:413 stop:820 length:408 start_codon:yes stop_codon:yes gene_type:complete